MQTSAPIHNNLYLAAREQLNQGRKKKRTQLSAFASPPKAPNPLRGFRRQQSY